MSQVTYSFAMQLYTLRHLESPLDELLGVLASMGYTGVETIGNHGMQADAMSVLLAKHGLQAISTHVGLHALEADLAGIVAFNQAIGNRHITVPAIPQDQRPDDVNGWERMGRKLDELGRQCTAAGMQLLYHNHAWEMEELEGQLALDWLMESADPANLKLEPDLAWIARGGVDVATLLGRYAGRCPRIHVKDLAPAGENEDQMGFADVGYGTLDWRKLLPAAQAAGGEWFIVEHDLPKQPLQTAQRSIEYLLGLAGELSSR